MMPPRLLEYCQKSGWLQPQPDFLAYSQSGDFVPHSPSVPRNEPIVSNVSAQSFAMPSQSFFSGLFASMNLPMQPWRYTSHGSALRHFCHASFTRRRSSAGLSPFLKSTIQPEP